MKENGKMINKKGKEKKYGQMDLYMREISRMESKMGKVNSHGVRVRGVEPMRENLKIIKYADMAHLFLMIIEGMKEIGKIIK